MANQEAILITGITGFIGSALARRLMNDGFFVAGIARPQSSHERLAALRGVRLFSIETPTIATLTSVLEEVRPAVVFNLAAAGVANSPCDWSEMLSCNVMLPENLVRAMLAARLSKLVHIGSCFEYAACAAGQRLTEDDLLAPFSVYGATKAAGAAIAQARARELQIDLVTLRLFGVYGPGEGRNRLTPYLVSQLGRGQAAELTSGRQERDLLYIDDVVDALHAAAACFGQLKKHQVLNVCSGNAVTVKEVGERVAQLLNRSPSLLHWQSRPDRVGEPLRIVGDNTRFCQATGWHPKVPLSEGLRKTIEHMAEQDQNRHEAAA